MIFHVEISYDYHKNTDITRKLYATVQNKFHHAIIGKTTAEIVYNSANEKRAYGINYLEECT